MPTKLRMEAMAGNDIKETAADMCHVASELRVWTACRFNDVELLVEPGGRPEDLVAQFHRALTDQTAARVAVAKKRPPCG